MGIWALIWFHSLEFQNAQHALVNLTMGGSGEGLWEVFPSCTYIWRSLHWSVASLGMSTLHSYLAWLAARSQNLGNLAWVKVFLQQSSTWTAVSSPFLHLPVFVWRYIPWFCVLRHSKILSLTIVDNFVWALGRLVGRAREDHQHPSDLTCVFTAKLGRFQPELKHSSGSSL